MLALLLADFVDGDDVRVTEAAAAEASLRNRVTNSSLAKRPASSILTATVRPRLF